jgi:hydrogenase small subunit
MADESIYRQLRGRGTTRRDFIGLCGVLAGSLGLALASRRANAALVARSLRSKPRVPVIWLELQDCAGCTEALTRSSSPSLVDLVLETIAIEYHETLNAASGTQLEENKKRVMQEYAGNYLLVVEGSIPTQGSGEYCFIGGRSAVDLLREAARGASAVIAIGNCATFGGIAGAEPNPTGAKGVSEIIQDKPLVNVPGCPPIPEVFTGTLTHWVVFGRMPELDLLKRPKTFYGTTIHDRCLRRPFYEAGKFARSFDDRGAREGWCLYRLGCKGPTTYNACASLKWDRGLSFPVQSGHPCLGCSEPHFWDGGGFYQGQSAPLHQPTLTALGAVATAGAVAGASMASIARLQKKRVGSE